MILAKSYQASGQTEKALLTYQQVFMSSGIPNRYLAPAIQNWMELLWERNDNAGSKSDRQIAYEGGNKFLKMTTQAIKKASPTEKARWEKISELVESYEASSDTSKAGE